MLIYIKSKPQIKGKGSKLWFLFWYKANESSTNTKKTR